MAEIDAISDEEIRRAIRYLDQDLECQDALARLVVSNNKVLRAIQYLDPDFD